MCYQAKCRGLDPPVLIMIRSIWRADHAQSILTCGSLVLTMFTSLVDQRSRKRLSAPVGSGLRAAALGIDRHLVIAVSHGFEPKVNEGYNAVASLVNVIDAEKIWVWRESAPATSLGVYGRMW
jgi:hypothetical protein